jgi:hypothetical protein
MSRTNQPIAVIDAGVGPNATLSKLLGAGYATASQCEAGGLYEYLLDQSGLPQVKVLIPNKLYLVPPGCLGTYALHWHLPQLVGRFANNPDAFGQYVLDKLAKLYAGLGARIILVDLPSATIRPFVWAFVVSADVINIVTLFGDTHIAEAQEALDVVGQILRAYNPRARVNLVINRVLNIKGGGSLVHIPTVGLNVFKLADSVEVRAWTDICGKPAVSFTRYAKGQDFRLWWSEMERLVETVWNQVGEVLR